MQSYLLISALIATVFAQGGHHHEYRRYECTKKPSGIGTDCTIYLKKKRDDDSQEFWAATNQECFEETGTTGKAVICPLYCPETGAAYSIWKTPSNNHKCTNLGTYRSINRNGDWYFWRTGECLDQEMTFEIGCHFLIPSAQADVEQILKKRRKFFKL
ncbi:unnamed protein product, partial [Mesorhabditis spiculigera]